MVYQSAFGPTPHLAAAAEQTTRTVIVWIAHWPKMMPSRGVLQRGKVLAFAAALLLLHCSVKADETGVTGQIKVIAQILDGQGFVNATRALTQNASNQLLFFPGILINVSELAGTLPELSTPFVDSGMLTIRPVGTWQPGQGKPRMDLGSLASVSTFINGTARMRMENMVGACRRCG